MSAITPGMRVRVRFHRYRPYVRREWIDWYGKVWYSERAPLSALWKRYKTKLAWLAVSLACLASLVFYAYAFVKDY